MPIITVKTTEVGCRKPSCKHRMELTHRHHRKCETLFITAFGRNPARNTKSKRFKLLCSRYEKFDERDVVRLCAWHHAEIHVLYDDIILDFKIEINKILANFTWEEADKLMRRLRKACYQWETEVTPGINPDLVFGRQRYRIGSKTRPKKKRKRPRKKKKPKKKA